ncbi:flavin reductase family protein [Rhodovulum sp. YNF3179]|uniref:flavin reductase family protein n=1 Tax=Rhodovulum sp. YNF3179 TaxID=3425127 RepID=UPI003D353D01
MTMPANALREDFLAGMSRAAATVSVVTTDGPAGRYGVTVSAMTSVSAEGTAPTMLVCVHHQSETAAAILGNGCFCINVLREDQAAISDVFARRVPAPGGDKFNVAPFVAMHSGAPRLADPLVAFDCRLVSGERVGTHHLFIGEVAGVHIGEGRPLLYGNRAYLKPEPHEG